MKLTRNDIVDIFSEKAVRMSQDKALAFLTLCLISLIYVLYRKLILDEQDIEYIFDEE